MNDAAVQELWRAFASVNRRLDRLETQMNTVDARIRARLKEEADAARA